MIDKCVCKCLATESRCLGCWKFRQGARLSTLLLQPWSQITEENELNLGKFRTYIHPSTSHHSPLNIVCRRGGRMKRWHRSSEVLRLWIIYNVKLQRGSVIKRDEKESKQSKTLLMFTERAHRCRKTLKVYFNNMPFMWWLKGVWQRTLLHIVGL